MPAPRWATTLVGLGLCRRKIVREAGRRLRGCHGRERIKMHSQPALRCRSCMRATPEEWEAWHLLAYLLHAHFLHKACEARLGVTCGLDECPPMCPYHV